MALNEVSRISLRMYAGPFERYARTAFNEAIGRTSNLRTSAGVTRDCCLLVGADVAEDGSYVDMTYDVPRAVVSDLIS